VLFVFEWKGFNKVKQHFQLSLFHYPKNKIMKKLSIQFLLTALVSFGFTACTTQTPEEKRKEELKESAEQLAASTQDLVEKLGENAEGTVNEAMQGLEAAVDKIKTDKDLKDPVNFRNLKELLPETVAGMSRTDHSGKTTGAMGFKISMAEASYEDGDQKLEIDIVDAGGIGGALMGSAAWSKLEIDEESSDGFKRTIEIDGNKSYQECSNNNARCQLAIMVADRFVVSLEGRKIEMDQLMKIAKGMDFSKLESM